MKYTVVLTEKGDGNVMVAVPGLPDCTVEATTRDEALEKARETINRMMNRSEILQLDVGPEPDSGNLHFGTPWEWFGAFKNNPTWGKLFDELERQRDSDRGI